MTNENYKNYKNLHMDTTYHVIGTDKLIDSSPVFTTGELNDVNYHSLLKFKNSPGIWTHSVGGDILDLNAIGSFLATNDVSGAFKPNVDIIFSILKDEVKLANLLSAILFDKNGVIKVGHATITFELMRRAIQKAEPSINGATSYLVAMLLNPIRIKLKLNAPSNVVTTFEPKENMYPTKDEFVHTIKMEEYINILKEVDYSFIDELAKSPTVSLGAVSSGLNQAFARIFYKLNSLERIGNAFHTVLILIRSYLTKKYDGYRPEQMSIFEDNRFLSLASIFTLGNYSMETSEPIPSLGDNYWMQCIELIGSMISTSSRIELIDLVKIKELYTISHIKTKKGFRKGIVISRNIKENQSFEAFKYRSVSTDNIVLYKDNLVENIFSGIHNIASKIDSTMVHDYVVDNLATTVTDESELFCYSVGIRSEEISIISYLLAKRRYLVDVDGDSNYKLVYEFTTDDSLIDDDMKLFLGRGITMDPRVLLMYSDSFRGADFVTPQDSDIFKEYNKNLYFAPAVLPLLDRNLKAKKSILMNRFTAYGNKTALKINLKFSDILNVEGLNDIVMRSPILGNKIISSLMAIRNELSIVLQYQNRTLKNAIADRITEEQERLNQEALIKSNRKARTLSSEAKLAIEQEVINGENFKRDADRIIDGLDLSLMRLLRPLVESTEVDDLTRSLIARIWAGNDELRKTKISQSILTSRDIHLEFKLRLAFFVLAELGFVADHNLYSNLIKRFNDTNFYSNFLI